MAFNQKLANQILEFAKLESNTPVGQSHDFSAPEFDEKDFLDTANQLISSGQITAWLDDDFSGPLIQFRQ